MIRSFVFVVFLLGIELVNAQLMDDFSDGNFDSNPSWAGDDLEFTIDVSNQLRLNSMAPNSNNESYLSTSSASIYNARWDFNVGFEGLSSGSSGGLSSSNKMFVYLVSDKANLKESPDGYYVLIGDSDDDISLYSTSSSTPLIDGLDDVTQFSSKFISIRVTRDDLGNWELFIDTNGGSDFSSQGTSFNIDFELSSYFGILCDYTSTRSTNFFFDDFEITGTSIPDTNSPSVHSVSAISATQVAVLFSEDVDEFTSQFASNYSMNNEVQIISANRDVEEHALVFLTTTSLTNGEEYVIVINNVEDDSGNVIAPNSTFDFQYAVLEEGEPGDIVINEFLADPSSENDLPEADFVELYNRSAKFIDLEGWSISDNSDFEVLPSVVIGPDEYLIVCDDAFENSFDMFGDVVSVRTFPNLNSSTDDAIFLRNTSGEVIAELFYSSSSIEDGISLELVNPHHPCILESGYSLSTHPRGGTPGIQNSVFNDGSDIEPPVISSYSFNTSLELTLSEFVDTSSLLDGSYSVNNLTIDQLLTEGDFSDKLEITFLEEVLPGTIYSMTIANIEDCAGNQIAQTTIDFGIGRPPTFNELIISEIMFDTDPEFVLPQREYVEIYNSANDLISTEGMRLLDRTSAVDLPTFMINPGDYVVLTSNNGVSEIQSIVADTINIYGVNGYFSNSLNNEGEPLHLSYEDRLIFSLDYAPEWHDESSRSGGFSLEMKDLTNPCVESQANWGSSKDPLGGTPGTENSLNDPQSVPDNFGPQLVNAVAIAEDTIRLDFDEKIDPFNSINATIDLDPTIEISGLKANIRFSKSLFVVLTEQLVANEPFTLSVTDVFDCNGNEVLSNQITSAFPLKASPGEILLSEVLFDPRTNGVDFVEVFNSTNKFLSLSGWQLARIGDDGIDDPSVITNDELVLNPNEYLAITENAQTLLSNYPQGVVEQFFQVNALPTYANDTGNVVLLDDAGVIQELFRYEDDFHYDLLESPDGVSLERVSFSNPTNDPNNWRSAASTVGFATPGYPNSQSFADPIFSGEVEINPKVFLPGNIGSGRDFTTINYQFDQPGKFANINIYDQSGRRVKNLAEGALLETSGFIRWDGTTNSGSLARLGYYVVLFEVYDSMGNSDVIKETVVVGRNF